MTAWSRRSRVLASIFLLAAALAGLLAWLGAGRDEPQTAQPLGADAVAAASLPAEPISNGLDPGSEATLLARESAAAAAVEQDAAAPAADRLILGRLIDEVGVGIPEAAVHVTAVGRERAAEPGVSGRAPDFAYFSVTLSDTTDAAGRFRIECPAPDCTVQLVSVPASERWCALVLTLPVDADAQERAPDAGPRDLGDLTVTSCGSARGRVVSASRKPITGVVAEVVARQEHGPPPRARTDENGDFLIHGIVPGERSFRVGDHPWQTRKDVKGVVPATGVLELGELVLRPWAEIRGRVVEPDGSPAPRVEVECVATGRGERVSNRSAEDGTFLLRVRSADEEYVLSISHDLIYKPWGGPDEPLAHVRAGAPELRIVLLRNPQFVFAVVDAASKAPVERFWLHLNDRAMRGHAGSIPERVEPEVHAGGELRLAASAVKHELLVRAPGYAPAQVAVREDVPGSARQTIELRPESRLAGRVVLGNQPVSALVRLEREAFERDGTPASEPRFSATSGEWTHDLTPFTGRERARRSDEAGLFEFGELAPGTYRLMITAAGAAEHWVRAIRLTQPGSTFLGDVPLPTGARIAGRVLMPGALSAAGVKLWLNGAARRDETAGENGEFLMEGLPAGKYTLDWKWPDEDPSRWSSGSTRVQEFVLAVGETRELTLDLRELERASIEVRIRRNGLSLERALVFVNHHAEDGGKRWGSGIGRTDAQGVARGRIDGSRLYSLSVLLPAAQAAETIELCPPRRSRPGERIELEFDVQTGRIQLELPTGFEIHAGATLSLEFRSIGSQGEPHRRWMRARDPSEPTPAARVWTSREVEFDDIPAGEYELTVKVEQNTFDDSDPKALKVTTTPLRPPFATTAVVREGERTVVRVP